MFRYRNFVPVAAAISFFSGARFRNQSSMAADDDDANDRLKKLSNLVIVSGSTSTILARNISSLIGTEPADVYLTRYSDGEIFCAYNNSIRGMTATIHHINILEVIYGTYTMSI